MGTNDSHKYEDRPNKRGAVLGYQRAPAEPKNASPPSCRSIAVADAIAQALRSPPGDPYGIAARTVDLLAEKAEERILEALLRGSGSTEQYLNDAEYHADMDVIAYVAAAAVFGDEIQFPPEEDG